MNLYAVSSALLFLCFVTSRGENPIHFTGDVSINCGSSGTSAARNGRQWLGDKQPKFSSLVQIKGSSSTASTVMSKFISADPVPHKTARISHSKFSYVFQVSPGQKIIRLHFHPTSYRGFKGFKDLFTVESGPFTLLGNFSASFAADALGVNSFVKEFCLNVPKNGQLSISFAPSSLDAYAFINGIEIISVPVSLSYFHGGDIGVQVVGPKSGVYVDYDTALEVFHRLSVKQSLIPLTGDFDGIFPTWATPKLDKEKQSTWKIPVDLGFRYLIRLHFSGLGLKIVESDDVIFKVLINEMIVHTNIDIVKERKRDNIPSYRDYLVTMRGNKKEGKRDLLISLQSCDELIDGHGSLAGFEILKLSNLDNSLASPNPFPPPPQDSPSLFSFLGHRNAITTVVITIIALVNIIFHKLRDIWEASSTEEENKPSARAERFCRRFSFAEIQLATENFNDAFLIGKGGFGRVYKGLIDKGHNTVAVKRLKLSSDQGSHEFLTEIEMLSELRHVNLVSLIGYCNEHREMILVYDYMGCGTLADHLYKLQRGSNNCCSLTWRQRLNICIGAGRGLDYLHMGHGIIHRDVKALNILLDENFVAKVADFGLAKPEDSSKLKSYISTKVKGTFGYLDPYYFHTHKLTRKSDTYAFGVVLLEVLCGRAAVDSGVAENERILSKWAQDNIKEGQIEQIVASCLRGKISLASLKTFARVVERCLCDEPKNRPTMSQVVVQLELALEQQVTPPAKDQPNRKDGSRATIHKPLRLWPWERFWNRVKPSKKNESFFYEVCEDLGEAGIKLPKFDWDTISAATNNFSSWNKIGEGGFGPVYKAVLLTGQVVAVKRRSTTFELDLQELKNEILLLPNLQHQNIVKLLGYCIGREFMLVYDYMAHGTLRDHLYNSGNSPLKWKRRLQICIDAARGLHYLHTGYTQRIIHRDVTSTNILLDEKWVAKVSDFSLSKREPTDSLTHIITAVKGSLGYLDPEYYILLELTEKSDVYSFGVVLFEVLCARPATNSSLSDEQLSLAQWAKFCHREGRIQEIIDPNLDGQITPKCLQKFVEIAVTCLRDSRVDRPTMMDVIWSLEFAMKLQLSAEDRGGDAG